MTQVKGFVLCFILSSAANAYGVCPVVTDGIPHTETNSTNNSGWTLEEAKKEACGEAMEDANVDQWNQLLLGDLAACEAAGCRYRFPTPSADQGCHPTCARAQVGPAGVPRSMWPIFCDAHYVLDSSGASCTPLEADVPPIPEIRNSHTFVN